MDLTDLQLLTLEAIHPHLKGDEITGREVAKKIGLKPRATGKEGADMRSIVNALRVKGYPICANGKGYFWAATQGDLETFITSFQGRINDQQKACSGMRLNKGFTPSEAIEL